MAEIDTQKEIYLFLHGRMDLKEKAMNALTAKGFAADKVTMALPDKVGNVGDYMAMLWMPPNPDHIKIQQITKVEEVESTDDSDVGLVLVSDDISEVIDDELTALRAEKETLVFSLPAIGSKKTEVNYRVMLKKILGV